MAMRSSRGCSGPRPCRRRFAGAGSDGGAQAGEAAADGSTSSEDGHAGGLTLGGVAFEQVISGVVGGGASGVSSAPSASGSTGAGTGPNAPGGSHGNASGTTTPAPEPAPPVEVPTEPAVTEEQERQFYNALSASAGRINGYVGEINGITAAFNNDCMADANTRGAARHRPQVCETAWSTSTYMRDEILVANDSRYKAAQGDLIGMYRLLATYAGVVHSSWQYAGNPDTVNTGIDAIRRAQGAELAEFQQVYGRFSL
ncbi:MAG: hypothetical protein ACLTKG_00265 [Collinsella intestinalis]